MPERTPVQLIEQNGLLYTQVPSDAVWDLVEYLSWQRVRVSYSYQTGHFFVYFLHSDRSSAQKLLDAWMASSEPASVGSGTGRGSEWLVGQTPPRRPVSGDACDESDGI